MDRTVVACFAVVALAGIASLYAYPMMPDTVPTHWGVSGKANGYSSREFAAAFIPGLMLALTPFLLFLPRIDPLRSNYEGFQRYYNGFVLAFNAFMLYIHVFLLYAGLGNAFNMNLVVTPAVSLLFIAVGIVLGKAKRNWFLGIRTPWTMSSDAVWESTHRAGGWLFIAAGILSMSGLFVPWASAYVILATSLGAGLGSTVLSYYYYRKLA